MSGMRKLKQHVHVLLCLEDEEAALSELAMLKAKQVVNPLFSFIQSMDPDIRARAVKAMGRIVSAMEEVNTESARVVMRRLMWSLNDESGGIGWGAPETMGEIMALNPTLAREYHHILFSYVNPDGNYLEFDPLRQEAVKGIKRLIEARPEFEHHQQACPETISA